MAFSAIFFFLKENKTKQKIKNKNQSLWQAGQMLYGNFTNYLN